MKTENPVTTEKRSVYDRIRSVLVEEGRAKVTDVIIAEEFGITPQSVYAWKIEKTIPDRDKLLQFARNHSVSVDWLLTEEGSKRLDEIPQEFADLEPPTVFSEEEKAACDLFRSLSPEKKPLAFKMLELIRDEEMITPGMIEVAENIAREGRTFQDYGNSPPYSRGKSSPKNTKPKGSKPRSNKKR